MQLFQNLKHSWAQMYFPTAWLRCSLSKAKILTLFCSDTTIYNVCKLRNNTGIHAIEGNGGGYLKITHNTT